MFLNFIQNYTNLINNSFIAAHLVHTSGAKNVLTFREQCIRI